MVTRNLAGTMILLAVGLWLAGSTSGCGRRAPGYAPGDLTVTSVPASAAIRLNGSDTGFVTPHTFVGLEAADYDVSVSLDGYTASPTSRPVDLPPLGNLTVDFTLSQTVLTVDSVPRGARILIDDVDTGHATPAVITGLETGPATVSLRLDTYLVSPSGFEVDIVPAATIAIPSSVFSFRSRRTVMLEGFANVNCGPCPELTDNLIDLAATPGFGADRMLYLEFSVNWPGGADPLYQANPTENTDRFDTYLVQGAPDLYVDGIQLADALDTAALRTGVEAGWTADPGFLVDVAADLGGAAIPVTVTLTPWTDRDLTDHVLYVALYETVVTFATAPGSNGQTEFHHVFRDRVDSPPSLGPLTAGRADVHRMTLDRSDRDPANLVVVAFVQNTADLRVLQAGSNPAPGAQTANPAPGGLFIDTCNAPDNQRTAP